MFGSFGTFRNGRLVEVLVACSLSRKRVDVRYASEVMQMKYPFQLCPSIGMDLAESQQIQACHII